MSGAALASIFVGGLVLGALYALMATGLALVWTTLGIFNFAHGAFIVVGAYVAWQVGQTGIADSRGLLGALVAIVALFALGVALHAALVRPFQRNANVVLLSVMTTLAGATILEGATSLIWGPRSKQIAPIAAGGVSLGGVSLTYNELAMIALAAAMLAAVGAFLRYSQIRRAMRAVAQNREAAELLGLDVERLYALAFGLSAALAGVAGVFVGSIRFMSPTMGSEPLMKALMVVIFGGVARFSSPIAAAFVIGMLEAALSYAIGLYWTPAALFAIMIVVLVIRPEGLFNTRVRSV